MTDILCQAIIFDLEGVLVDSTVSVERAWRVYRYFVDEENLIR